MINELKEQIGINFITYQKDASEDGKNPTCQSATIDTLLTNTSVTTAESTTYTIAYPEPTMPLCLTKKAISGHYVGTGADFSLRESEILANNDSG